MRLFLFVAVAVCTTLTAYTQPSTSSSSNNSQRSTDRAYYHYLYDISGSTIINDDNLNLKYFFNHSLGVKEDTIIWPIGFHAYYFGSENKNTYLKSFDVFNEKGDLLSQKKERIKEINNSLSSKDSVDQYTHVLAALKSILSVPPNTSEGIFIFTDGQLKGGDILPSMNLDGYKKKIESKIDLIKVSKPTFVVQTSFKPINDFFPIDTVQGIIKQLSDKAILGRNYFWVNQKYAVDKHPEIMSLYNEFLLYAHFLITNQEDVLKEDDILMKLLLLSKIFSLDEEGKNYNPFIEQLKLGMNSFKSSPIHFWASQKNYPIIFSEVETGVEDDLNALKGFIEQSDLSKKDLDTAIKLLNRFTENNSLYQELMSSFKAYTKANAQSSAYSQELIHDLSNPDPVSIEIAEKPKVGMNLEEALVLGLADYLIERTKQEALFIFYEEVYNKVMKPSSFIKDTLFYHFSQLIEPKQGVFNPNMVLVKESLNRDIELIPENLIKHPSASNSEELKALYLTYHLIDNLNKSKNVETAFEALLESVESAGKATSNIEKGMLFASNLIAFLKKHNLQRGIDELSDEEIDKISRLFTIWFISKNPDIASVFNLSEIQKKVRSIYTSYGILKRDIKILTSELKDLTGLNQNIRDLNAYKHEIMLSIFRRCTDIMLAGIDVLEHFPDVNDFSQIRKSIYEYKLIATSAADIWLELHKKNYAKAAALLIPLLPEQIPILLEDDLLSNDLYAHDMFNEKYAAVFRQKASLTKNLIKTHKKYLDNHTNDLASWLLEAMQKNSNELELYLSSKQITYLKPLLHNIAYAELSKSLSDADKNKLRQYKDQFKTWIPEVLEMTDDSDQTDFFSGKGLPFITNKEIKNLKTLDNYNPYVIGLTEAYRIVAQEKIVEKERNITISKVIEKLNHVNPMYIDLFAQYLNFNDLNEELKRLVAVAGEVSNAKTAGDIKNVLERYALPTASYRLKRQEYFTAHINAYTGFGYSYFLEEQNGNDFFDNTEIFLSAPVGLEFSWKMKKPFKSWGLFLPIIDVGNIINYRIDDLDESDSDSDREIRFEKVFSPGVHLVFGMFPRLPFSLNMGYQANPNRFLISLNFDLPVYRIK